MLKKRILLIFFCAIFLIAFMPNTAASAEDSVPFYIGNALNYADGDDSLSSASPTSQIDNITMEAWVKADTLASGSGDTNIRIMYNGDSGSTGYGIYICNNVPCILLGGVAFLSFTNVPSLTTSQWYHLAAVRNNGSWKLYVDGIEYTSSNTSPNALRAGDTFSVGNSSYSNENFTGCIDEVRFWTVARTTQQIKEKMYIKMNGDETGLLAYYNFDQEGINPNGDNSEITRTVIDVAGGNNNLTISSGFALNGTSSNFVNSVQLGTFALDGASYTTYIDDGILTIPIVRTGGSEGSVTINYETSPLTATPDTHYTTTKGSATFLDGQTSKNISIPILNSAITQTLSFQLQISAQNGVNLGTNKLATIDIFKAPVTSVVVSSETTMVYKGASEQFYATVIGNDSPPQTVTWSVTGNSSTSTTISTDGLLTVGSDETATKLTVKAASELRPAINDTSTITVLANPTVTSVSVTPTEPSVLKGGTQQFSATVDGNNSPSQTVIWSVTGNFSTSTKISTSGLLTVDSDETATTLTVKATSALDTSKNGTTSVTVIAPPPTVTSVSVTPTEPSVLKGGTQQFSATVVGNNSPSQTVTWSVTGNSSTSTKISTSGLLTVGSDEAAATLTVKATSELQPAISDTSTITVLANPTVTSVSVSPTEPSVLKGGTQQFSATVIGNNSPSQTVIWNVTGNNSTSTTISNRGLLTIGNDETALTLTVKATSIVNTSVYDTSSVSVTTPAPTVTSVSVTPTEPSVLKGGTQQFSAAVTGDYSPAQTVAWSIIGNTSTSTTISDSGLLTIGSDETALTLTVKATSTIDTSKNDTTSVTVTTPAPTVTSVTVTPTEPSVLKGGTQQFSATVIGDYSPAQMVTWSVIDNTSTSTTISDSGLLTIGSDETATFVTVVATSTIDTSKNGSATVTILSPKQYTVTPKDNQELTIDNNTDLAFNASEIDKTKFIGILIDGEAVSNDNIHWENGSSIMTLKASYLKTLSTGYHSLQFSFTDGFAEASFTISANIDDTPKTGDSSTPTFYLVIALMAGIIFIASLSIRRKHNNL